MSFPAASLEGEYESGYLTLFSQPFPVPGTPPPVLPLPPGMNQALVWIEPVGTQHFLNDPTNFYELRGATGMWMPPMDLQEQAIPGQPGAVMRLTLAKPRDVIVPLVVKGADSATLWDNLELLTQMFYNATSGQPGILRRYTRNGHVRDLTCYYLEGAQGDESVDNSGVAHMVAGIALRADNPFWRDALLTIQTLTPSGPVNFFASPFLPLKLSPSAAIGGFSIINAGDNLAWPIWQISGPLSKIVLSNAYTSPNGAPLTKTLALTISLGSSDTLTVTTAPGTANIFKQDGRRQFAAMQPTSSLWPLQPGQNQCGIQITEPGSNTQVILAYQQAYLAP